MTAKEKSGFLKKQKGVSAAKKLAAFAFAVLMIFVSEANTAAMETVYPAVAENIPSANFRLEGGKIIGEQKGFCVVLFDIEKGTKTEINLAHCEGEKPGECIISDKGIFMKSKDMTIEKIAGEWKLFGGRIYGFDGKAVCEIPKREEKTSITKTSASTLPQEDEIIENLRVRWLGEKTVAITNGERLFYYCIESGALTEKTFANRHIQSL